MEDFEARSIKSVKRYENVLLTYLADPSEKLLFQTKNIAKQIATTDITISDLVRQHFTVLDKVSLTQKNLDRSQDFLLAVIIELVIYADLNYEDTLTVLYEKAIENFTEISQRLNEWKETINTMQDMIFITDKDYNILRINDTVVNTFDMSRDDIVNEKCYSLFHCKSQPIPTCPFQRCLKTKNICKTEMYEPQIDKYLIARVQPILNREGKVKKIAHQFSDITELKKTEQKIETLHNWAQKLNQAEDMNTIFETMIEAVEQTLGFSYVTIYVKKQDILEPQIVHGFDSHYNQLLPLSMASQYLPVKAAKTENSTFSDGLVKNTADQGKSTIAVPIKGDKKVIGVLLVGSDQQHAFNEKDQYLLEIVASHAAVAIKKLQEKQKRVSLERLDELRQQFLTMAAHEIKTPLTPMRTILEMFQREAYGPLNEQQKQRIKDLLESFERLQRIVNDFRQSSQLQSKQVKLQKKQYNIANTIEKALKRYKTALLEEGIVLIKHIQKELTACYDENRIIQVIRNIVKNAIDYTKDRIWIRVSPKTHSISVSIRDNGSGIPHEDQKKLFKPFTRVEDDRSREDRRYGGTGLGLNICKHIVEAHGGEIMVESSPPHGTTFTFSLPKD